MASGEAFEILRHNPVYGDRRKARQSGENATTVGTIQRRKQMTARQRTFLEVGTLIFGILCALGAVYAWGTANAASGASDIAGLKQNVETTRAEIRRLDASDQATNKRLDEIIATQNRIEGRQDDIYNMVLELKRRGK